MLVSLWPQWNSNVIEWHPTVDLMPVTQLMAVDVPKRQGLKAQLPVFLRTSEMRFTILHDACRDACLDDAWITAGSGWICRPLSHFFGISHNLNPRPSGWWNLDWVWDWDKFPSTSQPDHSQVWWSFLVHHIWNTAEEPGSEKAQNRVEVVRLLCEARANKNAVDMSLGREKMPWIILSFFFSLGSLSFCGSFLNKSRLFCSHISGQFGSVLKGLWNSPSTSQVLALIKFYIL